MTIMSLRGHVPPLFHAEQAIPDGSSSTLRKQTPYLARIRRAMARTDCPLEGSYPSPIYQFLPVGLRTSASAPTTGACPGFGRAPQSVRSPDRDLQSLISKLKSLPLEGEVLRQAADPDLEMPRGAGPELIRLTRWMADLSLLRSLFPTKSKLRQTPSSASSLRARRWR